MQGGRWGDQAVPGHLGRGDPAADRGPQGNRVGNGSPPKEGKVRTHRKIKGWRTSQDKILVSRALKTQLPDQPHQGQKLQIGRTGQTLPKGHVDLRINKMGREVRREEASSGVEVREEAVGLAAGHAVEIVGDFQWEDQGTRSEVLDVVLMVCRLLKKNRKRRVDSSKPSRERIRTRNGILT